MIRPEKIVLHLSFPHPVYGTFTPVKIEDHQFIDSEDEKEEALDLAKKRAEEWFASRYPNPDGPAVRATIVKDNSPDPEIEHSLKDAIQQLQKIKWKEDAEAFLTTEIWMKYNKELKSIVNAKPNRP